MEEDWEWGELEREKSIKEKERKKMRGKYWVLKWRFSAGGIFFTNHQPVKKSVGYLYESEDDQRYDFLYK